MKTKILTVSGLTLALFCFACESFAQSPVALTTRQAELQTLSALLHQRDALDRQQVREYAQRLGIPVRRELPNGRVLELQRLVPGPLLARRPMFYITNNVDAADTVSTDEVYPGGSAGLNLDGSGMTIAQWDGGAVFADHPDFAGRLTQVDGVTEVSGHSTHVAGTLIGAGDWNYTESRGMAYAAQLDAYDWNSDTAEMAAAAAAGQLVSNHSYGIAAGWIYTGDPNPPETWWWIGGSDPSDMEDPYFGYYDAESQLWDQVAHDAPYYLPVKAAGNDRSDIGPAPGEEYWVIDQDGNFLFTSTQQRPPDCAPAGYDCLPTHSVAKNVLTVGAVDDVPGGYSPLSGPDAVLMADFSSWGPTDDGRIKPDLVGNGVLLFSAWPDLPYYALAAGTSMSAPNVTGSLTLLQQHYQNLYGPGNFMRATTLKALAIHTADEAGSAPGPDYAFGWGLLNTKTAAELISQQGPDNVIIEGSLSDGGTDSHLITVTDPGSVLTATLVWTDPPGTPVPLSLDPPDLMLVNDLDLRIDDGSSTHLPWILDPANPAAAATKGDNFRDNVEQVEVPDADLATHTVEVSHKGTLLDSLNQNYSLVISVTPPPPVGSGYAIDEDFSSGLPPGWSVHTDYGIPWTINDPVPGHDRLDNLTGGSGKFAIAYPNYVNSSLTSLRTHSVDLSINTAAVLRFRSFYPFVDALESLNVDVSTNGGSNWQNVWQWTGFNPFPTLYVLDLSATIAGESDVMIQFRWDSGVLGGGDSWQVDDVQLEVFGGGPPPGDPPGPATNPTPGDGAVNQGIGTDLDWTAGADTDSHDVYFGSGLPLGPGDFQGNQAATGFDPGPLDYTVTYYWRIDEVNANGTTTGATWSFSTEAAPPGDPPGQATNPSPADGAANQGLGTTLSWTAGTLADSHDVYFGTGTPLGGGDFQVNQSGTAFDPGPLDYATTYYWRIDEVNADGMTEGLTWSFSTEAAPAETIHIANLSGRALPAAKGRWSAVVDIDVADQGFAPETGVTVEGNWSNGANGGASCLTDASGWCPVQKGNLKNNVASVTFTVTSLSKPDMTYDPGGNVGGDAITISSGDTDQVPSAVDDSYQTDVDAQLSANVMDNDDPGDGPASIDTHSSPASGSLNLGPDGAFTYQPDPGFEGDDSFTYRLIDQDGDLSNSATVTISVTSAPPPPPPGGLTVTATTYKVKGVQHVALSWENFSGPTVEISRDGAALPDSPTANDGAHDDNLGVKGGGVTYTYDVCETGTTNCASASAAF